MNFQQIKLAIYRDILYNYSNFGTNCESPYCLYFKFKKFICSWRLKWKKS